MNGWWVSALSYSQHGDMVQRKRVIVDWLKICFKGSDSCGLKGFGWGVVLLAVGRLLGGFSFEDR